MLYLCFAPLCCTGTLLWAGIRWPRWICSCYPQGNLCRWGSFEFFYTNFNPLSSYYVWFCTATPLWSFLIKKICIKKVVQCTECRLKMTISWIILQKNRSTNASIATIECNHLSTICKLCSRHTFARRRFCVSWINHYMHRRFAHRANEVAQSVAGCFAIYM